MANMYMGRGGLDSLFNRDLFGGNPVKTPPQWGGPSGAPIPRPPIRPGKETPQPGSTAALPPNVLGAQTIRASGPSGGYDPAYLQNLATSIGGLFARPKGNMSFNPLGNLREISPSSGEMGSAPQLGEPTTWLQQALNGSSFLFKPPVPPARPTPVGGPRGGGGGYGGPRGRGGANRE